MYLLAYVKHLTMTSDLELLNVHSHLVTTVSQKRLRSNSVCVRQLLTPHIQSWVINSRHNNVKTCLPVLFATADVRRGLSPKRNLRINLLIDLAKSWHSLHSSYAKTTVRYFPVWTFENLQTVSRQPIRVVTFWFLRFEFLNWWSRRIAKIRNRDIILGPRRLDSLRIGPKHIYVRGAFKI